MKITTRAGATRSLMITAVLAGVIVAAPGSAMASSHQEDLHGQATYQSAGVGWDGVIGGRAAGTNLLSYNGTDVETFCIEYGVPAASAGTFTSTSWKDSGVRGLDMATDVAARHNDIAGRLADQRSENAATQLAIWHFTDSVDYTVVPNAEIVARATALVAAAQPAVAPSGYYSVSVDSQSYGPAGAVRTKVTVAVTNDAGTPAAAIPVRLTPKAVTLDGQKSLAATTAADGSATFDFLAPANPADASVEISPMFATGTVWAPANHLQMVVGVVKSAQVLTMAQPVELLTAVPTPTSTPTPTPEPTVTPTVTAVVTPVETPAPAVVTTAAVVPTKPAVLPHTGPLGTAGLFAALLAIAGVAGTAAWRRRSRA